MTCKQLGGACDLEFRAETFEEMKDLSKKHGMEMFGKLDQPHIAAMNEMYKLLSIPGAMESWMEEKRKEFDALP